MNGRFSEPETNISGVQSHESPKLNSIQMHASLLALAAAFQSLTSPNIKNQRLWYVVRMPRQSTLILYKAIPQCIFQSKLNSPAVSPTVLSLLPLNGDNDFASAAVVPVLVQVDALPSAESQASMLDWDCQAYAHHGGLQSHIASRYALLLQLSGVSKQSV